MTKSADPARPYRPSANRRDDLIPTRDISDAWSIPPDEVRCTYRVQKAGELATYTIPCGSPDIAQVLPCGCGGACARFHHPPSLLCAQHREKPDNPPSGGSGVTAPSQPLREDVAHALELLRTGVTDPDLWTRTQRTAVSRLHVYVSGGSTPESIKPAAHSDQQGPS